MKTSKTLQFITVIFNSLSILFIVFSYIAYYTDTLFSFDSIHWTIDAALFIGLSISFGIATLIYQNKEIKK